LKMYVNLKKTIVSSKILIKLISFYFNRLWKIRVPNFAKSGIWTGCIFKDFREWGIRV
jgi:hypothetical protein